MTVSSDYAYRSSTQSVAAPPCLEDRFEIIKDIGDGSFGSVVSARVRTGGAHIARRGTLVCLLCKLLCSKSADFSA